MKRKQKEEKTKIEILRKQKEKMTIKGMKRKQKEKVTVKVMKRKQKDEITIKIGIRIGAVHPDLQRFLQNTDVSLISRLYIKKLGNLHNRQLTDNQQIDGSLTCQPQNTRGQPSSFIIIYKCASSDSSVSLRDLYPQFLGLDQLLLYQPSKQLIRIQKRTRRSKRYSVSSRDSPPVVSRTGPIALVPAHLNYPLGYPGYRQRESRISKIQRRTRIPKISDAALSLYCRY